MTIEDGGRGTVDGTRGIWRLGDIEEGAIVDGPKPQRLDLTVESDDHVTASLSDELRRAINEEPTHDERGVASNYYDRLAARLRTIMAEDDAYQNKYGDRLAAIPAKPDVGERLREVDAIAEIADELHDEARSVTPLEVTVATRDILIHVARLRAALDR